MNHNEIFELFKKSYCSAEIKAINTTDLMTLKGLLENLDPSVKGNKAAFCYWLLGYLSGADLAQGLTSEQVSSMVEKFNYFDALQEPDTAPVYIPESRSRSGMSLNPFETSELIKC